MAAFFFSIFNSSPISCNFCLLCLKRFSFLLSDGEFYLVFRYIWFIYVFSDEKWVFFQFSSCICRMCMKNPSNGAIFFTFVDVFFLQNEMYCNLCLVSGNVSGFFSSDRDFFLVFKYVHVICFL